MCVISVTVVVSFLWIKIAFNPLSTEVTLTDSNFKKEFCNIQGRREYSKLGSFFLLRRTGQIITQYRGKLLCHYAVGVSYLWIKCAGNPPSIPVITNFNFKNNFVEATNVWYWVLLAEWLSHEVGHRNLSSCGHKVQNRLSVHSSVFVNF